MNILIIERNSEICEILLELLAQQVPHVKAICVHNVADAKEYFKRNIVDLVILDHYTYKISEVKFKQVYSPRLLVLSSVMNDESNCLDNLKIDKTLLKPMSVNAIVEYINSIQ